MGFPTFENWRELLPPKVRLNADDIAAQMQGFLGKEHHADGSHSDVTADSIDTGPVTIVSNDWWIALYRENAIGNRSLIGHLTQEAIPLAPLAVPSPLNTRVILQTEGAGEMAIRTADFTGQLFDRARFGADALGGPEQQMFSALSVQERFKLYGQGIWDLAAAGVILADAPFGPSYSVYALTASAPKTIFGINTQNAEDGARGQLLILWNDSTFSHTFQHNTTASPEMRLLCPGGVDLVLPPQAVVTWLYDIDKLKWRCIGGTFQSGTGGGGPGGMNLDYLGNYVAGPVYNDGDIVVAADGIAYLCVVDGTTTPPEPWPGVGIATAVGPPGPPGPKGDKGDPGTAGVNAAVDATYWTVTAHPGLTNERAMNALVNGYVKSTAGEPSTMAVIPLSEGGTGATTAPTARTNLGLGTMAVQNANAVAITGGSLIGPITINTSGVIATPEVQAQNVMASNTVQIRTTSAALYLIDESVNMMWRLFTAGTFMDFRAYNTDFTGEVVVARFDRAGIVYVQAISGNGAALTNLNASQLTTGIANPARLGSGTANTTTFLRGDGVWAVPPSADPFPSGLIVLSDVPCPVGWTRVNWDGAFLRVNASAGSTGGSASHQHGAGSLITANHAHGGSTGSVSVSISGTTSNDGSHQHGFSGHISGTTDGGAGSVQTADAGGSFTTLTPPHTHTFGADYGGTTGATGAHTHSFSGSGSGVGGIASEQVALTGQTDVQAHLPPYIDVILCRKN